MIQKMRQVELNPLVLVGILVVIAAWAAWSLWVGPARKAAEIQREWITPEAMRAREAKFGPISADKLQKMRAAIHESTKNIPEPVSTSAGTR